MLYYLPYHPITQIDKYTSRSIFHARLGKLSAQQHLFLCQSVSLWQLLKLQE